MIAQGKTDVAYQIYQKIAGDYPTPPSIQPNQAQPYIQEAQAISLFGMGSALEVQGKTADAGPLFTQLKTYYPWSPKVIEANFGIAKFDIQQGKTDDALKLLTPIVGNRNVPSALRANAFLYIGDIYTAKNKPDDAIDAYLKCAFAYAGVKDVAPEALWKGGAIARETGAIAQRAEQAQEVRADRQGGRRLQDHRQPIFRQQVRQAGPGPAGRHRARQMTRPERAAALVEAFGKIYPDAHCELDYKNPLELLVATILSAQCTDKRVNLVTPALFKKYRTAKAYAEVPQETLEKEIQSTGFFRSKAKSLRAMAADLVEKHGGKVPADMAALTALRGVGRKTANVVLGNAYDINEGVVVDTHVQRLSRRLGPDETQGARQDRAGPDEIDPAG